MRPGTAWGSCATGEVPSGTEDELRRFHLHLKAEPSGGKPVDFLQPGHGEVHGLTWATVVTLGRVRISPCGQLAGFGQRRRRTGPACVRPRARVGASKHLKRMPMNGGRCPGRNCGGHSGPQQRRRRPRPRRPCPRSPSSKSSRRSSMGSLSSFACDAGCHSLGEVGVLAEQVAEAARGRRGRPPSRAPGRPIRRRTTA